MLLCCFWPYLATTLVAREKLPLDADWKFQLVDSPDAYQPEYDTSNWRDIRLPHDWSIELATDPQAPSSGGGGFFPAGVGWYRRVIVPPETWKTKRVQIEFEGVYGYAEVWINGVSLETHAYGYTPFRFDLTPHLRFGQVNTLAIRVDNSQQPNSRWYTGSGIYRHVWLHVTDPVHIDDETIFVSTERATQEKAIVAVDVSVVNDSDQTQSARLEIEIVDSADKSVAKSETRFSVEANAKQSLQQQITVEEPSLWSPESPYLYSLEVRLLVDERETDLVTVPFGVRTVEVSSDKGLLLNGKPILLCGANVHHDNGPLGAAAFDRAEARRVEILKSAGFNAIRTSHNPPSTAFLDACDRLGMLVIAEAFDGWAAKKTAHDYGTVFNQSWERDLSAMILRDRDHPSIIMWSIGNEVYERGNAEGLRMAKAMVERVRELDPTRPVTAGINGLSPDREWSELDPLFATLDVAGYNYELDRHQEDHSRVPNRVIFSAESYPEDAFAGRSACCEYPYVIGDFVWSGMDYLGEAGIGRVFESDEQVLPHWEGNHYPWHGATCGDIDITGWRKPLSYYRNVVWDRGEIIYVTVQVPSPTGEHWKLSKWAHLPTLPSWTWPDHVGRDLTVEVYSRYPRVRLYLNDQLIGEQETSKENKFRAEFKTPYRTGTLRAVGVAGDQELEECTLTTASKPRGIRLTPDRLKIFANGQDLSFVEVEVVDQAGRLCPMADVSVTYAISGPGSIAGVGSGDLATHESYQANPRSTYNGRALVVVRAALQTGKIVLTASSPELQPTTVTIEAIPK